MTVRPSLAARGPASANGGARRHAAAQTAYLLYASDNNQNFKISQLDADYYNVTAVTSELTGALCGTPPGRVSG